MKYNFLLYSTENYIQYPMIDDNRNEYEQECTYIHIYSDIYISESLCYTSEINTTSIILQFFKKELIIVDACKHLLFPKCSAANFPYFFI